MPRFALRPRRLTGNIGFHHIHHLNPRVPNYRLAAAHGEVRKLRSIRDLGLTNGLRAPWLTLWDEASGRLVCFREADLGTEPGHHR